ncbi:MAG: phytanoyl-CoA dioxygenase family protein [Pseudomonadota bacterium]
MHANSVFPAPDLSRWLGERSFNELLAEYDDTGYVMFEDVLSARELSHIRDALQPHLDQDLRGRNAFEGSATNRVSALLAKSPVFAELVTHPLALAFAERDLGKSCLLSSCISVNIHPGETAQAWHTDDAHITLPRPRPSCGIGAFWSIDETTDRNGATELLPGSHRWADDDPPGAVGAKDFVRGSDPNAESDTGAHPDAVKITMRPGSLLILKGTVWHRGGANRSDAPRLVMVTQYCPGWARQIENQVLAVPPAIAATLPQRARELIGYSIHPPFMGFVDAVHPERMLPQPTSKSSAA